MSERRTVLITGASSGFGVEFARLFARDGFDPVLVARSGAAMEETAQFLDERFGSNTVVLPKDLAHPHAVRELVDNLAQRGMTIDVLVNNAGFAQYGPFVEADPAELVDMVQVNIVALTELTRALVPGMVARGWGRIVNLGSVGSFAPAPMTGAYAATKAFVLSFSLAIGEELRGTGVRVTALCPGPTETGFQARAEMADSKLIAGRRLDSADDVVRAGYRAMQQGRPYLVTGTTSKVFAFGSRFIPRTAAARIAARSQARVSG